MTWAKMVDSATLILIRGVLPEHWVSELSSLCLFVSGSVCVPSLSSLMWSSPLHSTQTRICPCHLWPKQVSEALRISISCHKSLIIWVFSISFQSNIMMYVKMFDVMIWYVCWFSALHSCLSLPTEPLSGVIEGVSAGLFLIATMVGVAALLICRQKARKVWVSSTGYLRRENLKCLKFMKESS